MGRLSSDIGLGSDGDITEPGTQGQFKPTVNSPAAEHQHQSLADT